MDAEIAAKIRELDLEEKIGQDETSMKMNLFSRVVLASRSETQGNGLTTEEIQGNLFVYLFAGVSDHHLYASTRD